MLPDYMSGYLFAHLISLSIYLFFFLCVSFYPMLSLYYIYSFLIP